MYTKYSTRRFKIDHLNRIRALKKRYLSQGVEKTQEQILVQVVEEGLKLVEQSIGTVTTSDFRLESDDKVMYELYKNTKRRIAPIGIRDEEST